MSLGSVNFAKFAKATATTVYLMTAVKATVRPAFNLADKKSDKNSRKYSAVNEFLYQVVCLGFAAGMIPFAERYGLKLAEKQLSKMSEFKKMNITHLGQIEEFKELTNVKGFKKLSALKKIYLNKSFDEKYVSKVKAAKEAEKTGKMSESDRKMLNADKALHLAYGGVDASSFIASILGLTILAPKVGHEILHPIMHAIGMNKKEGNDVGTPNELYLADAKIPTEKKEKINVNA